MTIWEFLANLFSGRKTKVVKICSTSGNLPNAFCPAPVARRYYSSPRPGEPVPPTVICDFHSDPDPIVEVQVCVVNALTPNPFCPQIGTRFVHESELPLPICDLHKDPDIDVPVEVCASSSLTPTIWCGDKKTIMVKKSKLPLASCPLHATPPPKTKYPFFVYIPELMTAQGNLRAFVNKQRRAGNWGVRLFLLQSWSAIRLMPWKQAIYQGQPVRLVRAEDRIDVPVYDMNQSNPEYWARLGEILQIFRENDTEIIATLGDNCSYTPRISKFAYPFHSSLNTMSREEVWPSVVPQSALAICTAGTGGFYGPGKYLLYQKWVKDAITFIRASGCQFRIEIQNEFSRAGWPDTAPEPVDWYAMMVAAVRAENVPIDRIVHSGDYRITQKHPGIFSMHQIEQAGMYSAPDFILNPSMLMLSADGGYAGSFKGRSLTDIDIQGRHGVSVSDAIEIAQMIREKKILGGYEWMPKRAWRYSDIFANVDDLSTEIPDAMRIEWSKLTKISGR